MLFKMKAGPLSDPIMEGSPSLGMSLSMIFLITMDAVSFLMGKASIQPEKVSTMTRLYLYPYLPGLTSV